MRVAINYGNPVLAQKAADGTPQGVSVVLAKALGRELGIPVTFSTYDAAGKVFTALETQAWDVAFIAIDPVRAEQILFSEPYVLIEGTYLVARDAGFHRVGELDQPGIRVAVGQGSAYDLYLTRALKHAQLVRVATSAAAIEAYREQRLDAAAGVRQPLEKAAAQDPNVRVLSESFTSIRQAMAVPQGHQAGAAYIQAFVERMKASGFVRSALIESGQADVSAPPESGLVP
ncbi:transporter substrate-binding domain-containing protein [Pseudomonas sp. NPDC089547]|uniref:transporter substrate-binding domain-containing protein n=1 Tax=Pseudomonas sp. NPDC089547 TaxID=3390652 RepID=UPI003CFD11EC